MGRKKQILIVLMSIFFISACSDKPVESETGKEVETKEKKMEQKETTKPDERDTAFLLSELPAPTWTVQEIVHAAAGEFSGQDFSDLELEKQNKAVALLKELPKIGKNPTEDEIELYWRKSLELFHEDYPNPANVLDEIAIESFGNSEIEDERYQFKDKLNVEIILDASGSMAKKMNGKTMMDTAKEAIEEFAGALPGGANIALRVYGHKGSNEDKDKEVSCKSNELVYDMQSYDQTSLQDSLNQFKPTGFTPLANALTEAKKDLEKLNSDENTNIIYVVSDGVETCNGDPVAEAKKLAESDIQPIVNVIGFDVDSDGQNQLKEVAKAAKGLYADAKNQEQLKEELEKTQEIAKQWEEWKRDAVNGASSQRYEQMRKNIPRFGIEWGDANSFEKFNMRQPLNMLKDEGHISRTAFQLLSDKTSERYSHIMELRKEVENDLRNLADQSFEEAREEINQKYKENSE
ncbi:VWA domain-containing protein [Peribacillus sp. FSL H8-0477]|uniref:VWA domain-containing protein n=1 Tax=Peribacillus sp. FSL H8-0477 TaxID=2921388 RepID=UPI0030FBC323